MHIHLNMGCLIVTRSNAYNLSSVSVILGILICKIKWINQLTPHGLRTSEVTGTLYKLKLNLIDQSCKLHQFQQDSDRLGLIRPSCQSYWAHRHGGEAWEAAVLKQDEMFHETRFLDWRLLMESSTHPTGNATIFEVVMLRIFWLFPTADYRHTPLWDHVSVSRSLQHPFSFNNSFRHGNQRWNQSSRLLNRSFSSACSDTFIQAIWNKLQCCTSTTPIPPQKSWDAV